MTGRKFQTILIFIQEAVRPKETAQNWPKKNVCIFDKEEKTSGGSAISNDLVDNK